MEIEKEREEFEKEAFKQSGGWATFNKAYGNVYENKQLNFAWLVWLAAKQQAVPEGFVLVPKEPTLKMSVAYEEYAVAPCSSLSVSGYKAMIEAQEQSHD
jgi:hypothetical protein